MVRVTSALAIAGLLAVTLLPAQAQQPTPTPAGAMRQASPAAMMAKPGDKGILVETKDPELARRLVAITRGAPADSYRVQGWDSVQHGSLALGDLEKTKEMAASRIIIIVDHHWHIIIVLGARAAAYQQKVLEALSAADKSSYTLDRAK
jgi:hypothetical protein